MKKLLVALGMALIAAVPISASKRYVAIKTRKESNQKDRVERPRAPIQIPVTVSFDDKTLLVEVIAPSDLEGQVFLYDAQGNIEDFSLEINTTLHVFTSGVHTVVIQGATWTAEGEFEYNNI